MMKTQLDPHSVAVISGDDCRRQTWLDSSLKEEKNKTGLNLETYGSVGKRWDDSETPTEKTEV